MRRSPLLPSLQGYQRAWLGRDVVAGLTLVAVAVPEQMATARLANLPAIVGLYAFVYGSLLFALVGTNRRMSVGADSTIAPVFAAGVAGLAAAGTPRYGHLVALFAVVVGVLLVVAGLARLGWVADFLSGPVVTGMLAGIGIEIFVRQLPVVLGLRSGGTTTIGRLRVVGQELGHVNGWVIAIAVLVLSLVVGAERIDRRWPGALVGVVLSVVAVAAFDLKRRGVAVLGTVHGGLPSFGVPPFHLDDVRRLVPSVLTVTFLCIVQSAATVRATGGGADSDGNFNADLIGVGAGSLVAGFGGGFPVNSSPPRTAVIGAAGGRSQLTGLVAAGVVLAVALAATGVLTDLPQATLGGILIFVATRLLGVAELRRIFLFDRFEFGLALVTLATVALVGIQQGVVVAILLSVGQRTSLAARPRFAVLGREPGTDHWIARDIGRPTEDVPGIIVFLPYAPLWFGNAAYVRRQVEDIVDATHGLRAFVLDCDAMSDIDFTGTQALKDLTLGLRRRGVTLAIARSSHLVHHDLKHGGLLEVIGPEHLYATVEEAAEALAPR